MKDVKILKRGEVAINKQEAYAFVNVVYSVMENVDKIMQSKESVERGKLIAAEMNRLEGCADRFKHFQLNVPINKLKKLL